MEQNIDMLVQDLKFVILCIVVVAVLAVGLSLNASAQESSIPAWIKHVAQWWSQDKTNDSEFLNALQYLIDNNILHVSSSTQYDKNFTGNNVTLSTNENMLSKKLSDLQARYDSLQAKYDVMLQQVRSITPQASKTTDNVDSISAVAVRPVIQSDGFFETTKYEGTILKITVQTRDGSGLVLVNTAIPTGVDFQTSARTAVAVAENVTSMNLSRKDVIFSISSGNNQDLKAVDGGSAGGAMTVLLISDLLNKTINKRVLMTGTIQLDGSIGPIGAVSEKADAAGQFGAKLFLVPSGQGVIPIQTCSQKSTGSIIYQTCTTESKGLSSIMQNKYGMKVVEISSIDDALKYFNSG